MNGKFAAAAVAAAILAAPAGAQEEHDWREYDWGSGVPTAAEAWRWLEADAAGKLRGSRRAGRSRISSWLYGFGDGSFREERDALSEGLAGLVVGHAGTDGSAAVVRMATKELYYAAVTLDDGDGFDFPNGEVGHRGSLEALRRIFEALEPFPLCYQPIGMEFHDPDAQPPFCEVSPPDSPWCVAGRALYSAEVDRGIGHTRRSDWTLMSPFVRPETPPEVRRLSEGAAMWWGRCWDGRIGSG